MFNNLGNVFNFFVTCYSKNKQLKINRSWTLIFCLSLYIVKFVSHVSKKKKQTIRRCHVKTEVTETKLAKSWWTFKTADNVFSDIRLQIMLGFGVRSVR